MICSFVPIRIGSKSIPEKNIKLICGKPLVYWILKALQTSSLVDKIIVASDSDVLNEVVNGFEFTKVEIYRRLEKNSRENSSTESVMLEYLEQCDLNDSDIFMLNQATSPLTKTEDIDSAILKYKGDNYDSLLSCSRLKRFIWDENSNNSLNYDYKNRPLRQQFDGLMMENGAIYINKVKSIKENQNRLSGIIGIYEMEEYQAIEIDEEYDWIIAEKLCERYLKKEKNRDIKLFASDIDGVLTDGGMYLSSEGEEMKKFNTRDGMGFKLLRDRNVYTALLTSEKTSITKKRAKKLNIDFLGEGLFGEEKANYLKDLAKSIGIGLDQVCYIGDDINCLNVLKIVGIKACPSDAVREVKNVSGILKMSNKGGEGAVREMIDYLIDSRI